MSFSSPSTFSIVASVSADMRRAGLVAVEVVFVFSVPFTCAVLVVDSNVCILEWLTRRLLREGVFASGTSASGRGSAASLLRTLRLPVGGIFVGSERVDKVGLFGDQLEGEGGVLLFTWKEV